MLPPSFCGRRPRMKELSAIVLAAGIGKRMRSAVPKVLHRVAGHPLVHYPVQAAVAAGARHIVVVASPSTRHAVERSLGEAFGADHVTLEVQDPPRGTGDAARIGVVRVDTPQVLILCGDTPLLTVDDLRQLVREREDSGARIAVLTALLADPTGYGRVLRDAAGVVLEVREHRDLLNEAQRAVCEVNSGVYCADTEFLRQALGRIAPANAQGEYYLTDVVAMAAEGGLAIGVQGDPSSLVGVNDRTQLAAAETALFARRAVALAGEGVTILGEARIEQEVVVSGDVTVGPGCCLRGKTRIGQGATLDVGCVLTDADIGAGAYLGPYCVVERAVVEAGQRLQPHTYLAGRPN